MSEDSVSQPSSEKIYELAFEKRMKTIDALHRQMISERKHLGAILRQSQVHLRDLNTFRRTKCVSFINRKPLQF